MEETADKDLLWSDNLLEGLRRTQRAFRMETGRAYALAYEHADFQQFLAGTPVSPLELKWWRPWLEEISRLTADGKTIDRVRVVDDPATDYQRWELWAVRWHRDAGERIYCIPRSLAQELDLPVDHDWWLLDDDRVIVMWFTSDGEVSERELITEPGAVARYCTWRDLAVRNATPAEEIAAV